MNEYAMGKFRSGGFYIFRVKQVDTISWKVEEIIITPGSIRDEVILGEKWDFSNAIRSSGRKDLLKNLFLYYEKI